MQMAFVFKFASSLQLNAGGKVLSNTIIPGNRFLVSCRGHKRWSSVIRRAMKVRKDKMEDQNRNPRNTFIEWNYNAEIFAFGKRLGEDFKKEYLQQAFTERSYIITEEEKQKKVGIDEPVIALNDNLEYVKQGEFIIKNYVRRYLRAVHPRFPEEGICSVCDFLLSDEVLADISKHLGTADIILSSENPPTTKTLANVLKAIVYALELSSGKDKAQRFIRDFIITYLSGKDINEFWEIKNPESVLASILETEGKNQVEPRLIGEAGKTTILAVYRVGLYCDKEFIGLGFGETISVAKEVAAMDALKRMFHTTERDKPIPFNLELSADSKEPFANISIQDWCEKNIKAMVTKC